MIFTIPSHDTFKAVDLVSLHTERLSQADQEVLTLNRSIVNIEIALWKVREALVLALMSFI